MINYNHDVFISYATLDNEGKNGKRQWVSKFKDYLEDNIKTLDCWIDNEGLPGNAKISKSLYKHILGSRTLFVILTENYVDSKWCNQELDWFYKIRYRKDQDATKSIFIIRVTDPGTWKNKEIPKALETLAQEELRGYSFYDEGSPFAFCWPDGYSEDHEEASRFRTVMADVRADLHKFLVQNRQPPPKPKPFVFLSYTNWATDRSRWESLRNRLQKNGYEVGPKEAPPPTSDWRDLNELIDWLKGHTENCVHYIHFSTEKCSFEINKDQSKEEALFVGVEPRITVEAKGEIELFNSLKIPTLFWHDKSSGIEVPEFTKHLGQEQIVHGDFDMLLSRLAIKTDENASCINFCVEFVNEDTAKARKLMKIIQKVYKPACFVDTLSQIELSDSKNQTQDGNEMEYEKPVVKKLRKSDVLVIFKFRRTTSDIDSTVSFYNAYLLEAGIRKFPNGVLVAWPKLAPVEVPGLVRDFETFDWIECDPKELAHPESHEIGEFKDYIANVIQREVADT